jgi:hypothetical protein
VRITSLLIAAFLLAAFTLHRETKLRSLETSPTYVESRSQLRSFNAAVRSLGN